LGHVTLGAHGSSRVSSVELVREEATKDIEP
jgi:hypothetical protein